MQGLVSDVDLTPALSLTGEGLNFGSLVGRVRRPEEAIGG
jgi:hypothetical protein